MSEATRLIGEPPEIAGSCSGELLIASTGWNLKADLAEHGGSGPIMAVNCAGMFLPRLAHWFTCDTWSLKEWEAVRLAYLPHANISYKTHSKMGMKADVLWPFDGRTACTSGLTAALVAILLGYDRITLAGLPGDDKGHFYPDTYDEFYTCHEPQWRLIAKEYPGRVTSLSGNTKEWLS